MAFVQTVFVQAPAASIAEVTREGGLVNRLEDHLGFLQHQRGFQSMRITRSVNESGNVLLLVETVWLDDRSLIEYETGNITVLSIINEHSHLILPETLQVLDLEAIREESAPPPPAEVSARIALPLFIPLGVLAFALLVVYALSRVYLDVSNEVATGLAAGIAIGVLAIALYVATHPRIGQAQIAGILGLAVALLVGGVVFAAVNDEGEAEHAVSQSPTASPGASPGGGDGADATIRMLPQNRFDVQELTLPASTEVTVHVDNTDGIHNWAMYTNSSASNRIAGSAICPAPCREDVEFTSPAAGQYFFRCDVHADTMTGRAIVR